MDKIAKALSKLDAKERKQIKDVLSRLYSRRFKGLEIKKLRGRNDIFRVKKGNFRIIYRLEDQNIFILAIDRRRESTYRL